MARLTGCEGEIGWTTKVDVRLIVDFSGESCDPRRGGFHGSEDCGGTEAEVCWRRL